jgi:hypothetical protein
VSSRPTVELKTPDIAGSLIALDAQSLKDPVHAYINHKISKLRSRTGYTDSILNQVSDEARRRAENTFLWVALVFKKLDSEYGWHAVKIIKEMPPGLPKLYEHMMTRIERRKMDQEYCKNVLAATSLAYRPLSFSELGVVAGLNPEIDPQTIVEECGSFLITKKKMVYLIHQSAKDYLTENWLQPIGVAQGHANISRRSVEAMSIQLKQNMYDLSCGFRPKDLSLPNPDPMVPLRYSCVFWADHLCFGNGKSPECTRELTDDGIVFGFLKERFLRWLESLSLLGNLSDGVQSIRRLLYIAQVCFEDYGYMQILSTASHNWIRVLALPGS